MSTYLSDIFNLTTEIVDNTSNIVALVMLGVVLTIAVGIGAWIKKLLDRAIK